LAGALEQNNLLLQEVHHRVKNNLQAVASLIHLAPIETHLKQDMSLRLLAMAAIHEQAYRSDQYGDVLLSEYLRRLLDGIRRVYGDRADIEATLNDIVVDRDQALPIGLIANEVLSNVFKHAFMPGERGHIDVSLRLLSDRDAELRISDNGKGYDTTAPATGIGSRLVRGLVAQLDGDVEMLSATGTTFRLRFKLSRKVAPQSGP
jgi:two-component sensor histidine kinase